MTPERKRSIDRVRRLRRALLEAAGAGASPDPDVRKVVDALVHVAWVKAPGGYACRGCGMETLERSRRLMGGPWSGVVRCTGCGRRETLASYLGKAMVEVRPLKPGEAP